MQRTSQETEVFENLCRDMIFNGTDHKLFFLEGLHRCRQVNPYFIALIYCLGISDSTRRNVNSIFDFSTGLIKPESLLEGWQTSGSMKVTRLAFNLYTDVMPRQEELDRNDEIRECAQYTVSDIFCCSYAKYFWQAVKLRYPEFCQ